MPEGSNLVPWSPCLYLSFLPNNCPLLNSIIPSPWGGVGAGGLSGIRTWMSMPLLGACPRWPHRELTDARPGLGSHGCLPLGSPNATLSSKAFILLTEGLSLCLSVAWWYVWEFSRPGPPQAGDSVLMENQALLVGGLMISLDWTEAADQGHSWLHPVIASCAYPGTM